MDAFFTPSGLVALVTLTILEIVLGVDNVIFISILSSKLPGSQQSPARRIGLLVAMGMRVLLLLSIVWMVRLTAPLFSILGRPISGRDLILIGGGLFLLAKATTEIHERLEGEEGQSSARVLPSFAAVITQIALLDIVFSLDSVITAVGMARQLGVMIAAVIIALVFMLFFAGRISDFIHKHPSLKMLALGACLFRPALLRTNRLVKLLAFELSKWSMADVMVLAIFMSFVAFNGVIGSALEGLRGVPNVQQVQIPTNASKILPGYYLFIGFCVSSIFLSKRLEHGIASSSTSESS